MSKIRIQVIMDVEEKIRFQQAAARDSQSLSTWLKIAGYHRLAATESMSPVTPEILRAFFEKCDQRERKNEPDWTEHLAVINSSRGSGKADS